MKVMLGNVAALNSERRPVPDGAKVEDLRALAEDWGVPIGYSVPAKTADGTVRDDVDPDWVLHDKATLRSILEDHWHKTPAEHPGVTEVTFPDDVGIAEAFQTITLPNGLWRAHSSEPAAWVWSDSPGLQALLAEHFGCDEGVPDDVEDTYYTPAGPPGVAPDPDDENAPPSVHALAGLVTLLLALWLIAMRLGLHLRTNAGVDHQSRVTFDTASNGTSSYAAANYIAVTETAVTPAAGDTTLSGELAADGFTRAQATYAHTNGTNTTTLTKTFTMSGGTSRTLRCAGLFNASSTGTMAYETAIPSPPTLVPSDSVALTWTFTF